MSHHCAADACQADVAYYCSCLGSHTFACETHKESVFAGHPEQHSRNRYRHNLVSEESQALIAASDLVICQALSTVQLKLAEINFSTALKLQRGLDTYKMRASVRENPESDYPDPLYLRQPSDQLSPLKFTANHFAATVRTLLDFSSAGVLNLDTEDFSLGNRLVALKQQNCLNSPAILEVLGEFQARVKQFDKESCIKRTKAANSLFQRLQNPDSLSKQPVKEEELMALSQIRQSLNEEQINELYRLLDNPVNEVCNRNALSLLAHSRHCIRGRNFSRLQARYALLDHGLFVDTSFAEANLQGSSMVGATFLNCDFAGCNLTGVRTGLNSLFELNAEPVCFELNTVLRIGLRNGSVKEYSLDGVVRDISRAEPGLDAVKLCVSGNRVAYITQDSLYHKALDGTEWSPISTRAFFTSLVLYDSGRSAAVGCRDGEIMVYLLDSSSEQILNAGPEGGHTDKVSAFDAYKQRYLASGGHDQRIILWSLQSFNICAQSQLPSANNPESQLLPNLVTSIKITEFFTFVASEEKTIYQFTTQSLTLVKSFQGHCFSIRSLAVSPNGQFLAAAGRDCQVSVTTVENGQICQKISGTSDKITALAFNSSSEFLYVGSRDCFVRGWRITPGEMHVAAAYVCSALSPDETSLAVGTNTGEIILWKNNLRQSLDYHNKTVTALEFPSDTFMISGSLDCQTVKWDLNTVLPLKTIHWGAAIAGACYFVHSDNAEYILAAFQRDTVRLKTVDGGGQPKTVDAHQGYIDSIDKHPTEPMFVTSGTDSFVKLWAIFPLNCRAKRRLRPSVQQAQFGVVGTAVYAVFDLCRVVEWKAQDLSNQRVICGFQLPIEVFCFWDNCLFLGLKDNIFVSMDYQSEQRSFEFKFTSTPLTSITVGRSTILFTAWQGTVKSLDPNSITDIERLPEIVWTSNSGLSWLRCVTEGVQGDANILKTVASFQELFI